MNVDRLQGTDGVRGKVCIAKSSSSNNPISAFLEEGVLTEEFFELYQEIKLPFWCQTRPETINEYRVKQYKAFLHISSFTLILDSCYCDLNLALTINNK